MMKTVMTGLLVSLLMAGGYARPQDVTTVTTSDEEISDHLDLEAVASVFGDSKDLEDFEKRLNDPQAQISNLDLNGDDKVDYLRVVEAAEKDTHLVVVQAVIGQDQFQDVATIEVEKDSQGETRVQVVGDVYMYGPGYIIEPVYVRPPLVVSFFWAPVYRPWRSPYHWGYYPPYYRPWRPYPVHTYHRNVSVNVNVNHTYNYTKVRNSHTSVNLHNEVRKNDFAATHPDKSFSRRNEGVANKKDLQTQRKTARGKSAHPSGATAAKAKGQQPKASSKKGQAAKSGSTSKSKSKAKGKSKAKSKQKK
ncbi:MAG: hypothetical protein JXQ27_17340 [Acidobacteria bacterium]|nr:hypothetical protein [Acidobacteriota bacterium]